MQLATSKKTGNVLWDFFRDPMTTLMPGGAILATPLKLGTKLVIAGGAVAATAAYSYFQKNGIGQTQEQKQAATTGGYTITAEPGSTVNIEKPTTGAIDQSQAATQTATQIDMSWLLIIGIIAIGGLMLLKK